MTEICRVCLNVGNLISLFDSSESINLSDKIMFCTSIQVIEAEDLPTTICESCVDHLNTSYRFRLQCETSDLKLRNKLCDIKAETFEVPIKGELDDSDFSNDHTLVQEYDGTGRQETGTQGLHGGGSPYHSTGKVTKKKKGLRKKKSSLKNKKAAPLDKEECDVIGELEFGPQKEDIISDEEKNDEHKNNGKSFKKCNKEQCFTCGKVVSSRFRLKMHMRIHTGEKPFACGTCGKSFALAQSLKVHRRVHTGEKPLLCGTCGKAFAQSAGLVAHQRLHTGETPYCCTLCPLRFRTFGHLQYHIRQHTGEKNFECTICLRAFITRSDLTQHSKTHTGERPHVCPTCGVRMSRASHLTRHLLTHSGEKPHRCADCGASYAQKGDLVRHAKKHNLTPCKDNTSKLLNQKSCLSADSSSDINKEILCGTLDKSGLISNNQL